MSLQFTSNNQYLFVGDNYGCIYGLTVYRNYKKFYH